MTQTSTRPSRPATRIDDPSVRTWRAMLELHADLIAELEREFIARHGLTVSEFDVLANLSPRAGMRHGELASRVILTRTALTRLIDRLVTRGLVERSAVSGDQRGVLVSLSDEGRRVRRAAMRTNTQVVRRAFAGLDPDQTRHLGELVAALHHAAYGN